MTHYPVDDELDIATSAPGVEKLVRMHEAAGANEIVGSGLQGARLEARRRPRGVHRRAQRARRSSRASSCTSRPTRWAAAGWGATPQTSVANPWGELHDTPGVWIGDACAFPSASGTNPMVTIMALARRTAHAIANPGMTEAFRTPDERFADLPDFPWEPSYREVDGLRLAHIDVGEGRPVVLFHGEPTWSYPLAQGDAAAARRGLSLHRSRLRRLRPLRQADGLRLVLVRPPQRASQA